MARRPRWRWPPRPGRATRLTGGPHFAALFLGGLGGSGPGWHPLAAGPGSSGPDNNNDAMATKLETETPHPDHSQLDEYATRDLVRTLIEDQSLAAEAVKHSAAAITAAVEAAVPRIQAGGR